MIRVFKGVRPQVDPSAYVDVSAQVIGDVHIGPESSIWMNVVVRGDVNYIRIGARTNIQDLTLVHVMRDTHPTVIGDDVTIGHSAVIHGCTIENRCLIGMGAILLNGCTIGDGLDRGRRGAGARGDGDPAGVDGDGPAGEGAAAADARGRRVDRLVRRQLRALPPGLRRRRVAEPE